MIRAPMLVYASVAVVLFALQTRLIFPGASTQGQTSAVVEPEPDEELVVLKTTHGDKVVALFGAALTSEGEPRPDAATCPTILYFYGNGMCLKDAKPEFDRFRKLGANVMIPEYVGYGMSGGKPSEVGCQDTANAAWKHLRGRKHIDPKKIVVVGWSLGAAVAIDVASREPAAGLAVFSAFTRMADLSKRNFPFLPASLVRHHFDSQSKIGRVTCPILLGHGRRDQSIPFAMADKLAAAANAPVMRFAIEDAGHNDFFAVGERTILDALERFLESLEPRD